MGVDEPRDNAGRRRRTRSSAAGASERPDPGDPALLDDQRGVAQQRSSSVQVQFADVRDQDARSHAAPARRRWRRRDRGRRRRGSQVRWRHDVGGGGRPRAARSAIRRCAPTCAELDRAAGVVEARASRGRSCVAASQQLGRRSTRRAARRRAARASPRRGPRRTCRSRVCLSEPSVSRGTGVTQRDARADAVGEVGARWSGRSRRTRAASPSDADVVVGEVGGVDGGGAGRPDAGVGQHARPASPGGRRGRPRSRPAARRHARAAARRAGAPATIGSCSRGTARTEEWIAEPITTSGSLTWRVAEVVEPGQAQAFGVAVVESPVGRLPAARVGSRCQRQIPGRRRGRRR